ncbi:MAG TPA: YceH family protein, partial [Chthoniobacteraceae bacterium]|nr:YceH family protein [Chthoniobacteraceae bacterium]
MRINEDVTVVRHDGIFAGMQIVLSSVEARILGCLLEKERTTPENYPISLNSLVAACNQSTNRDPVVSYDEKIVGDALFELREKKLVSMIHQAGARVEKYRHQISNFFELQPSDVAVMTVLLLRGPLTLGELRARAERMYAFNGLDEAQACLDELAKGDEPLVKTLPAKPGQKEQRYIELLSAERTEGELTQRQAESFAGVCASPSSRIDALEDEVA